MEEIEDNLDMRDFLLHGQDVRIPHVHSDSLNLSSILFRHFIEEGHQGGSLAVLSHPDHSSTQIIQDDRQVSVSLADGDLVDSQNTKFPIIGLAKLLLQEVLVDFSDSLPVQSQMVGHFFDGQHLAELVNIAGQSFCHPLIRNKQLQVFGQDALAGRTENLAVLTAEPNPSRSKVEVSDDSCLLAVNL